MCAARAQDRDVLSPSPTYKGRHPEPSEAVTTSRPTTPTGSSPPGEDPHPTLFAERRELAHPSPRDHPTNSTPPKATPPPPAEGAPPKKRRARQREPFPP
jgi:hypothetical protein